MNDRLKTLLIRRNLETGLERRYLNNQIGIIIHYIRMGVI